MSQIFDVVCVGRNISDRIFIGLITISCHYHRSNPIAHSLCTNIQKDLHIIHYTVLERQTV